MTNQSRKASPFDLSQRTLEFGKRIIKLAKSLPNDSVNRNLVSQIVRSGTSVGANYCEADESDTKKDFKYRIMICRKEAKETNYWLNLIIEANPGLNNRIQSLLNESRELVKIFASISRK
ncbi:four helix bundle protein [Patescibacteria group bacterium]|nr:four helix bundle protein [Patescibacteria group bacterium]